MAAGFTIADACKRAEVNYSSTHLCLAYGVPNEAVEDAVAELLGKPVEKLFKHRRASPSPPAPLPEGAGEKKKRGRPRKEEHQCKGGEG
jgi:hypothetical protein